VYRAYSEVVPELERDPARLEALRQSVLQYKPAQAIARKQKASGLWGGNLLAPAASKAYGWTEPGTDYQYRRLLELGWPPSERVFRNADRFLFQLLSRIETDDPDRAVAQRALELLVEFQRAAKADPGLGRWARRMGREGAACALARGGHSDDPRVRGTAHTIASNVSLYLRSELAANPFKKAQGKTVLDPHACPPTIFAVEMLAFLPPVQRERAGFIERLQEGTWLGHVLEHVADALRIERIEDAFLDALRDQLGKHRPEQGLPCGGNPLIKDLVLGTEKRGEDSPALISHIQFELAGRGEKRVETRQWIKPRLIDDALRLREGLLRNSGGKRFE